jgi:hypothetical protein
VYYAVPYIRVADLYLMKAEALNEYYGPSQEVYGLINTVRQRAGVPDVEVAYANTEWVTEEAFNKHLNKDGLRDIILRERINEFAFEGALHFWDMIRTKRAVQEFSNSIWGWNYQGTASYSFFTLQVIQGRKWSLSDNLWPIKISELNANANLIQNPGW